MAENNAPEVKLNENPEGTVSFATDVVATIAGLAANEVEGVAGMTGASSSLADILTRKNTRNYTRGVKVESAMAEAGSRPAACAVSRNVWTSRMPSISHVSHCGFSSASRQ